MKNKCPSDEQVQRTKQIIKLFKIENGEQLTKLYCKSDGIFLSDVFEKNILKVSINEVGINPLYCVSLPGYTNHCGLKYINIILQTLQDKDLFLTLENKIRGGISSVIGDRYE